MIVYCMTGIVNEYWHDFINKGGKLSGPLEIELFKLLRVLKISLTEISMVDSSIQSFLST